MKFLTHYKALHTYKDYVQDVADRKDGELLFKGVQNKVSMTTQY